MGLSEREFLNTTPRYFYFRHKGFEALQMEQWQRTRTQAFYSFLPHVKKNALRRPSDLFRLPTDTDYVELTPERKREMMAHLERAKKYDFFAGESIPKAEA